MKSCIRPLAIVSATMLLINWGSGDSSLDGRAKPVINFHGTIQDNTGTTFEAQNITINGQFRQIAVHPLPTTDVRNTDYDPTINTALLDFAELKSIEVPNPHTVYTFKNRNYIMITVTLSNQADTPTNYIIDLTKKLFCDQMHLSGPLERELKITALEKMTITGYQDQIIVVQQPQRKALMKPSQPVQPQRQAQ